jgi:hypothetical protein
MIYSLKVALRSFGFKPKQRQPESQTRDLTRRELFAAMRKSTSPSNYSTGARSEHRDDKRSGRLPSTSPNSREQGGQHD